MPIKTRRDLLRGELAFALAKAVKIVRGLRQALTREEREPVADAAVKRIADKPYDPGSSMSHCRHLVRRSVTARQKTGTSHKNERGRQKGGSATGFRARATEPP